jgi:hypothetical protein
VFICVPPFCFDVLSLEGVLKRRIEEVAVIVPARLADKFSGVVDPRTVKVKAMTCFSK